MDNVRKWLFNALKLVVKEYYRRKKREGLNIDEVFNDVSVTFVNGFRDTRIILKEAIENIDNFKDEKERDFFELIAVHGFSYNQVAKQMGLTRRQVEYKYNKLIDKIINYLRGKGIDDIGELL